MICEGFVVALERIRRINVRNRNNVTINYECDPCQILPSVAVSAIQLRKGAVLKQIQGTVGQAPDQPLKKSSSPNFAPQVELIED